MLYIMRHGKTDWNAVHRLQGSEDIPLNEEGRQMARDARKKYGDLRFDICYCSPLQRAQETAEIFLEGSGTPILTDDRLREMGLACMKEQNMSHRNRNVRYTRCSMILSIIML